jgi:hypothetical protein
VRRFVLATTLGLLLFAFAASMAGATVSLLTTFKTEIDVKLKVSQHSGWNGIRPGCFAPQESFDTTITAKLDSSPSSKSKIKAGTTSLMPGSFGTTASYGAKNSFVQSAKSGMWDLQVQNPASCDTPAPPVPSWAVSPTCKKISERVWGSIIQHDTDGDATSQAKLTDGSLLIMRVPKFSSKDRGKSIGDGCLRSLREVRGSGVDAEVDFMKQNTYVQVPIPRLQSKLDGLTKGGARGRPSFKINIKIGGDCNAMTMSPSIGENPSFQQLIGSSPHQALGSVDGDFSKSPCTVSGSGRAIVRRVGKVVSTGRFSRSDGR